MVFRIITIISVLGILGRLTYLRFLRVLVTSGSPLNKPLLLAYFFWLGRSVPGLFRPESRQKVQDAYKNWTAIYPRSWMKWAVVGLVLSFLYLAASGFVFAIFSSRAIFGIPLLVHVISGGIFAVCLAAVLVFRAKEHAFLAEKIGPLEFSQGTLSRILSGPILQSILFWLFVVSGLFLVATALFSMLPYFSFRAQIVLADVHKYSALAALLTAIAFLDTALLPEDK